MPGIPTFVVINGVMALIEISRAHKMPMLKEIKENGMLECFSIEL